MPQGLLYQQDFISREEEAALLAEIGRLPLEEAKYKAFTAKACRSPAPAGVRAARRNPLALAT